VSAGVVVVVVLAVVVTGGLVVETAVVVVVVVAAASTALRLQPTEDNIRMSEIVSKNSSIMRFMRAARLMPKKPGFFIFVFTDDVKGYFKVINSCPVLEEQLNPARL
jgi:hypothetical protein